MRSHDWIFVAADVGYVLSVTWLFTFARGRSRYSPKTFRARTTVLRIVGSL